MNQRILYLLARLSVAVALYSAHTVAFSACDNSKGEIKFNGAIISDTCDIGVSEEFNLGRVSATVLNSVGESQPVSKAITLTGCSHITKSSAELTFLNPSLDQEGNLKISGGDGANVAKGVAIKLINGETNNRYDFNQPYTFKPEDNGGVLVYRLAAQYVRTKESKESNTSVEPGDANAILQFQLKYH